MANITLKNLGVETVNQEVITLDFNNEKIEVLKYLPVQKKLEMISEVLSNALSEDTEGFYNPIKLEVFAAISVIEAYTNIKFSEEEKEDIPHLYDLLKTSDLLRLITVEGIGEMKYSTLLCEIEACMRAITVFNNSFYGVIKNIGANKDIVNFDIEELRKKLQDPESLALLKEIAPLLGQNL